jgi:hypothetical protein
LQHRCTIPCMQATQVMHVMDVWHEYFVFGFGRNVRPAVRLSTLLLCCCDWALHQLTPGAARYNVRRRY